MICFRDMTFCSAAKQCENAIGCFRHFDRLNEAKANLWAIQMNMLDEDNNPAPRVAYSDFSKSCLSYKEKKQ